MPVQGPGIIFLPLSDARSWLETFQTRRCNAIQEPLSLLPPVNLHNAPGFSCSSLTARVARASIENPPHERRPACYSETFLAGILGIFQIGFRS